MAQNRVPALALLLGSLGAGAASAQILNPPNAELSGRFGRAIAAVPDVNGDGKGDVVVGAWNEDPGSSPDGSGRAYIYSGANGQLLRTLVSLGAETNGNFGWSVAGIPDVNGDNRGDVVIGAPYEDPGTSPGNCGRAYVYSGATGAIIWKLWAPIQRADAQFGWSVAGIPDVNGDGRGDIAVGANFDSPPGSQPLSGRVYLYSGATGTYIRTLAPPVPLFNGQFGWAIAGVPDVNGDNRGDILVSSPFDAAPGFPDQCGRVYLYSGSSGALLRSLGSAGFEAGGNFGFSVAGLMDVNGDGRGDLLIGAPLENPGASPTDCGRAYILSGATGGLLKKLLSPTPEVDARFGYSVAGLPDVNGDGRGDAIVGAPNEDPGAAPNNAGRVHVYSGASGARLRTYGSSNPMASGRFGVAVAGLADVNGDGKGDLAIGTDSESPPAGPALCGRAYIIRY